MQAKHSRTLGNIITRLAFDAERNNYTDWLCDRLFLRVVSSAGCRAERILASLLKEWEIHRMKSRIAREIDTSTQPQAPARGIFFDTLSAKLETVAGVNAIIDTSAVLSLVLTDRNTISSRILEMYGVTEEDIYEAALHTDENEDNFTFISSVPFTERTIPITTSRPQEPTLLERFTTDLTATAARGGIDPIIGRDAEIERVIQILGRRKKNNPVLIGEAGVGKSVIVEGLALRITEGKVRHRGIGGGH